MRKNLYPILVIVTGALLLCIFIFSKESVKKAPPFKNRKGTIALSGEWLNSKKAMEGLLAAIEQNRRCAQIYRYVQRLFDRLSRTQSRG